MPRTRLIRFDSYDTKKQVTAMNKETGKMAVLYASSKETKR